MLKKVLGLSVLTLALAPAAAGAATITVDSLADPGTVSTCTLRQAIDSAVNDPTGLSNCDAGGAGSDDIVFDPSLFTPAGQQTIQLSDNDGQAPLLIVGDMTIAGPGAGELAIHGFTDMLSDGNRVIDVDSDWTVTISDLEVTGGDEDGVGDRTGGGIRNLGDLTLTRVVVDGNQVTSITPPAFNVFAYGGGIASLGTTSKLTLDHSVVTDNTAEATNNLDNSDNAAAGGGGIYSSGTLQIHHSVIDGNTASATDTGATPNTSFDTTARGGGIEVGDGAFTADHSSITENESTSSAGGANTALGGGGGIAMNTFTPGLNELQLSTVAFNRTSGTSVHHGSGVYLRGGALNIVSSTIAYNGADPAGTIAGANLSTEPGPGSPTATIQNTIIANPLVSAPADNCFAGGSITSHGNNIEFPAATGTPCYTATPGDINADPKLAADLAFNGGETLSLALLPGSGAIDVGDNTGQGLPWLAEDQRGLTRPVDFPGVADGAGNGTDIGAFEVQKECASQTTPGETCPLPPVTKPPPGPTGQRAAALKKCKKKKSKKARNKCRKRAKKLPV